MMETVGTSFEDELMIVVFTLDFLPGNAHFGCLEA